MANPHLLLSGLGTSSPACQLPRAHPGHLPVPTQPLGALGSASSSRRASLLRVPEHHARGSPSIAPEGPRASLPRVPEPPDLSTGPSRVCYWVIWLQLHAGHVRTGLAPQPPQHRGGALPISRRDAEIEDLKTQLSRMQEDWIEEECHRVEAQLALKEARKEIKQLKQVIDTVKNNLLEKDKGLQKYFVDINIQNKKLETLLHSMEVAQNGALKEEGAGESAGGSPARSLTRSSTYTKLSDQGAGDRNVGGSQTISLDEGADSGFAGAEDAPGHTDPLEVGGEPGGRLPPSSTYEKLLGLRGGVEAGVQASCMQERAIQTDFVPCQPDLDTILEKVMKSQACSLGSPTSAWVSEMEDVMPGPELSNPAGTTDLPAAEPDAAAAGAGAEGGTPCNPAVRQPPGASPSVAIACVAEEETTEVTGCEAAPSKSYWSRHFIVDLLAVVVPAVPTVAWLCRSQRRQGQPIYNISSLLRGCCTVALHSIRRMGCRPVASPGGSAQP